MKEEERRAKREKIEDGEIFRREKIIKIIFKWEQEKKKKVSDVRTCKVWYLIEIQHQKKKKWSLAIG